MAVSNKRKSGKTAEKKANVEVTQKPSQNALKEAELRAKAIKLLHPEAPEWLKKNLGVDVNTIPVHDIYAIARGELTKGTDIVVTPLAYDREQKKDVEMPKMRAMVSVRAVFPMEKGEPVSIDAKHPVFLQTVPFRPYAELAGGEEIAQSPTEAPAQQQDVKFTDSMLMALEGVGISRERMFGGFNHLSREEKANILSGEIFPVDGNVKTSAGYVNVIGEARMSVDDNGKASVMFESSRPEKRSEGLVLDIERARVMGNMELDIFERTTDGKVKRDANNNVVLNDGARNLMDFGSSLEPMTAYFHKRVLKDNKWVDKPEKVQVDVAAINGNLYAMRLKEKEVMGEGKKPVTVYEHPMAKVNRNENMAFVLGETKPLKFLTYEDMESYLRGFGGRVEGASYKDFKTGKTTTYDAFVTMDASGYAKKYSPSATEEIMKRRKTAQQKRQTTRRRVKFGQSL